MDIAAWLRGLGLECYEQAFRDNDVDADVLPGLTAEDLKDLGITSVGHRRKILDAIAALARPAPAAPDAAPPPRGLTTTVAAEAERRQLTVMFCDLVGSSALAAELDPEDMGEIIRAYQRCATEVVERLEGHVAKYLGDGVLAYFGYPRAHEDSAERSVRAGLGIVEAVGALRPREGLRLRVRVGIATGPVVVGELIGQGTAQEQVVVGDAPNVAARLQELAEPDAVVIGPNTLRLIGGVFECADLGRHELKGLAEPVRAWRVLGPSRVEGRFEARQRMDLTPLVAREHEVALLLARWELAKDGEGQVVLLCGEPGIGKSRVTRALRERLGREAYTPLRYHCSPYHRDSALHPIADQIERAAGFHREDAAAVKLDKLEVLLGRATGNVAAVAPLVAELLAIPTDGRYPPLDLTPQRRREKLFEALLAQLEGLAAKGPVLEVFEDAHWIDPTSLELLGRVVDRVPHLPVLLLITFRPEFTPPWTGRAHVTSLSLSRLGRRQATAMIERVTGGKALPAEVSDQIVAKTDGVPLFVEELTKAVLESGLLVDAGDRYELAGPLPPLAVPTTLYDSLMARLDRLAPVKEVAQIGATIGREFAHELLAAVAPLPEAATRQALDQLVAAELVFRHGTPPEATYSFKHALVQDAAYQSLLRSRRQQLHARIAQVLEQRFPETVEAEPELLARHFTEAGLAGRAVEYWHRAGQHAVARSANVEAIGHLTRSLEALKALPDAPERTRRELEALMALGPALMAAKGEAAPEVEETYVRARALCERLGDTPQLFRVLRGLWIFYLEAAKLPSARELGEQLLALAEDARDDGFLLEAHRALGITLFWQGELVGALAHLEQGAALYDPGRHRSHALVYGLDPAVHCLAYGARSLWFLGYPDQALRRIDEALARAREAAHPFSLAAALYFAGRLHQYRREGRPAQARAEAAMALSSEQRFPEWLAVATALRGAALLAQGDLEAGTAQMREGLRAGEVTGGRLGLPLFLALLAEGYGRAGSAEEGLRLATEALALGRDTGERVYEAELHRIEGEMLLLRSRDGQGEAETRFRRAIDLARSQGARSLELRAATSLARLWRDRGKRAEAHDLLASIYNWFTEGLDTADLKDARALLDGLDGGGARSPHQYLGGAPA